MDRPASLSPSNAERVRQALEDLAGLEAVIQDKPPEVVRDLVGRIVEKVTVYFVPNPKAGKPRVPRTLPDRIDVTFLPDVANLFTPSSRSTP
jgi:hypothetical protein